MSSKIAEYIDGCNTTVEDLAAKRKMLEKEIAGVDNAIEADDLWDQ